MIDKLHQIQEMFMCHLLKHMVMDTIQFINHRPFWKLGNPNWSSGKKKIQRKRSLTWQKQPLQFDSNSRLNFVNQPLSNFDLFDWVKKLGIKYFKDIFSHDALPKKIGMECGIVNIDDIQGPGTHWVCYRNLEKNISLNISTRLVCLCHMRCITI